MMKSIVQRFILGYLALTSVVIGVWAQFAPRSFYDDFPGFGHVWVRVDGPYNEHLVRDVGGLNLALAAVLIGAIVSLRRPMVITASIAALLYGAPHVLYHVFNRDGLNGVDVAASLGGLAIFAILPLILLLWVPGQTTSDRSEVERVSKSERLGGKLH
jgi:hypothetical protein